MIESPPVAEVSPLLILAATGILAACQQEQAANETDRPNIGKMPDRSITDSLQRVPRGSDSEKLRADGKLPSAGGRPDIRRRRTRNIH